MDLELARRAKGFGWRHLGLAAIALLSVHCSSSVDDGSGQAAALSAPETVECNADSACGAGSSCIDNVCQLQRCVEPTTTTISPLGKTYRLTQNRQLLAANDADPRVDAYDGRAFGPTGSYTSPAAIVALTGGAFLDSRQDALAIVKAGVAGVTIIPTSSASAAAIDIALPFTPVAIAGGDLDSDGHDEVVALGPKGEIGVCHAQTSACDVSALVDGSKGIAVATGNIDGTGVKAVFLTTDAAGTTSLTIWSPSLPNAPGPVVNFPLATAVKHIAVGDIDGDKLDDIVALDDSSYLGSFGSTALHVYRSTGGKLAAAGTKSVTGDSINLQVGQLNGSVTAQIAVLKSGGTVDLWAGKDGDGLSTVSSAALKATPGATRLAIADVHGDSAFGTLVGDPQLVQGRTIPIVAVYYPPFSKDHSDGKSQVVLSHSDVAVQSKDSAMSLRAAFVVGYEAGLPLAASVNVSARVEATLTHAKNVTTAVTLSETFTLDPRLDEPDNDGGVLLAGACYHAFAYKVSDPGMRLGDGADGKIVSVLVPVGAQKAIWSLKRYNELARAIGGLPIVPETAQLGDPSTYPTATQTFDNTAIAPADLVLKQFSSYRVSDVARISWSLNLSKSETNADSLVATATAVGTIKVAGVSVGAEGAATVASGYAITLGTNTSFAGTVPPLPKGPNADDDAYAKNAYSFTPVLYRQHYKEANGADASFYVMNYTVGK